MGGGGGGGGGGGVGGGGVARGAKWWKRDLKIKGRRQRRKHVFKSEENNDQVHKGKENFVLTC